VDLNNYNDFNRYLKNKIMEIQMSLKLYINNVLQYCDTQVYLGLNPKTATDYKMYYFFDSNPKFNSNHLIFIFKRSIYDYMSTDFENICLFLAGKTYYIFYNNTITSITNDYFFYKNLIIKYKQYELIFYYLCYYKLNANNSNGL
jgi:hypothetical protein